MQLSGTDLRILRVFDAVVRHGGFSAAQAELNISQSTISNHITALEERLGVRLCQRGRSGFRLTEKGEIAFAATQRLLRSHDDFSAEVGVLRGRLVGELRIGLIDCVATDLNAKIVEAFSLFEARTNQVTLHLHQATPQALQKQVLEGGLHLGIGSFPHKIKGLEYSHLYEEDHGLYCSDKHPLFAVPEGELRIEDLQKQSFVNRGYWREEYRKNLGFDNIGAVVYQIEPQLLLILSGSYIGFLPAHFAENFVAQRRLRRLASQEVSYRCGFDVVLKNGYRPTQVVETFLADLRVAHAG